MEKTISPEMYAMLKPALELKIKSILKEAFELALFVENPNLLEKSVEELSEEYGPRFEVIPENDGKKTPSTIGEEFESDFQNQNLVTGQPLTPRKKTAARKKTKSNHRIISGKSSLSSKYRGVSWNVTPGNWRARLCVRGKHKEIGRYKTEIEAAKAYDAAKVKATRSLVGINFPEDFS